MLEKNWKGQSSEIYKINKRLYRKININIKTKKLWILFAQDVIFDYALFVAYMFLMRLLEYRLLYSLQRRPCRTVQNNLTRISEKAASDRTSSRWTCCSWQLKTKRNGREKKTVGRVRWVAFLPGFYSFPWLRSKIIKKRRRWKAIHMRYPYLS